MEQEDREITVAAVLAGAEAEYARSPEVSAAEKHLHGEFAGVVQLLRRAAAETRDAHALACSRRRRHPLIEGDLINRVQRDALDQAVEATWEAKARARIALREVAHVPPQLFL